MNYARNHQIAGWKTSTDWQALRPRLSAGDFDAWREAFEDFYVTRLSLRYLHPIEVLQQNGTCQGEGFSIVAIQCSLIEFLESTEQGKNYRYVRRGDSLGPNEYKSSQDMFIAFLTCRAPFSGTFNDATAKDFYSTHHRGSGLAKQHSPPELKNQGFLPLRLGAPCVAGGCNLALNFFMLL
jgi:hypothetical protein